MSTIYIESNSEGIFIIDNTGIRSTEPVEVTSYWEGDTLKLKGVNAGNSNMIITITNGVITSTSTNNSNVVISNCNNLFGGLFGHVNTMQIGNMTNNNGMIVTNNDEYVTIGGVRYKREGTSPSTPPANSNKKIFSEDWSKTGRTNIVLGGLLTNRPGQFHINCSLDESCDISGCGSVYVVVYGNHPKTALDISLVGSGDVIGKGCFRRVKANLSGTGDISGFHALEQLRVQLAGSGDIKLTHDPKCHVQKSLSGSGDLYISQRNFQY